MDDKPASCPWYYDVSEKVKPAVIYLLLISCEMVFINTIFLYVLPTYSTISVICYGCLILLTYQKLYSLLEGTNFIWRDFVDQNEIFNSWETFLVRLSRGIAFVIKQLLDMRRYSPSRFCIIASTIFYVLIYVGSLMALNNLLYFALICIDMINLRRKDALRTPESLRLLNWIGLKKKFHSSVRLEEEEYSNRDNGLNIPSHGKSHHNSWAEAADISILRFKDHFNRENEDLYEVPLFSKQLNFFDDASEEPCTTQIPMDKHIETVGITPAEIFIDSPNLQLTNEEGTEIKHMTPNAARTCDSNDKGVEDHLQGNNDDICEVALSPEQFSILEDATKEQCITQLLEKLVEEIDIAPAENYNTFTHIQLTNDNGIKIEPMAAKLSDGPYESYSQDFEDYVIIENEKIYEDTAYSMNFEFFENAGKESNNSQIDSCKRINIGDITPAEDFNISPHLQLNNEDVTDIKLMTSSSFSGTSISCHESVIADITPSNKVDPTNKIEHSGGDCTSLLNTHSKSTQRKKLFTSSSKPEIFLPTDITTKQSSPHSIVKKELSSTKSVFSFLKRHSK